MSNNANVAAAIKEVAHKVFGGYAELLRMPHTARFSIGSVIACMPFPMVGMTITISVQHYYGNYSLAGVLTAIQAIALAVSSPCSRETGSAPTARSRCPVCSMNACGSSAIRWLLRWR